MTNKPDDREKLLAGAFHDDWCTGEPARFARVAAAAARQRMQRRRRLSVAGAIAAIAVIAAWSLHEPLPKDSGLSPSSASVATVPSGYEIISDDELLAQLRDRTVLAVTEHNGTRRFFVIESTAKAQALE